MFKESSPRQYVTGEYLEYQRRYAENVRESDKVLLNLLGTAIENGKPSPRLLDIGCSSGNLLRHIKGQFPQVECFGADLFPEIVEFCRSDPHLAGMHFEVMDVRDLPAKHRFDIITANAVLDRFDDREFDLSIANIARALSPGGWFLGFSWFHPFEQVLSIREVSVDHPEGLTLIFRPFSKVAGILKLHGFSESRFIPFDIPVDLEKPTDPRDIRTYTYKVDDGSRLNFRGSLFLPWCHFVARKSSAK